MFSYKSSSGLNFVCSYCHCSWCRHFVVFLITICNDPSVGTRSWLLFWSTFFWLDSTYISLLSSCCIWHFTAPGHEEIELLFFFPPQCEDTQWIVFREEVRNNLVCHISVLLTISFFFLTSIHFLGTIIVIMIHET